MGWFKRLTGINSGINLNKAVDRAIGFNVEKGFNRAIGGVKNMNIGKFFNRAFGGLGGEGDKLNWIPPEKLIAKPSAEEEGLLKQLYPYARTELARAGFMNNLLFDKVQRIPGHITIFGKKIPFTRTVRRSSFLDDAVRSHKNLYGQVLRTQDVARKAVDSNFRKSINRIDPIQRRLDFSYFNTMRNLNPIAQGELPDSYKRAINRTFEEQLGGILNTAAKRGIINSSVTQRAISDAAGRALDMQVKYLPIAAQMARQPLDATVQYTPTALNTAASNFRLASQYAPLATNLAQQKYNFAVSKPLGVFSTLRDIQKDYVSMPANMWNTMMSARHSVKAMPVVKKGKPGLLSGIGMLGGAAIGGMLGGPMGAMVGANVGGYLGSTL